MLYEIFMPFLCKCKVYVSVGIGFGVCVCGCSECICGRGCLLTSFFEVTIQFRRLHLKLPFAQLFLSHYTTVRKCEIISALEYCRLLECNAMWVLYEPTFRRYVSPLSSG
jgi:hypothetical protein